MNSTLPWEDWEKATGTVTDTRRGGYFVVQLDDGREVLAGWHRSNGCWFGPMQHRRVLVGIRPNPNRAGFIIKVLKDKPPEVG